MRTLGRQVQRPVQTSTGRIRPVFVGGTGRSGTTVTAKLLGAHPACHALPIEVRFITDPGGLCEVAQGRTTFPQFRRKLLRHWFHRQLANGEERGLYRVLDQRAVEDALPILRGGLARDPWRASEAFVHAMLDPIAAASGADRWVEMTPPNVHGAPAILRMFPDMQLIHSVRDGRDVACSVAPLGWGPSTAEAALDWWAESLEDAFAACDQLPGDRVLIVQLEDLVGRDREHQLARLCEFVGLDIDPAMRAYFESDVTAERAHVGRWRDDILGDRIPAFEAQHAALVARLRERGRPIQVNPNRHAEILTGRRRHAPRWMMGGTLIA